MIRSLLDYRKTEGEYIFPRTEMLFFFLDTENPSFTELHADLKFEINCFTSASSFNYLRKTTVNVIIVALNFEAFMAYLPTVTNNSGERKLVASRKLELPHARYLELKW